MTISNSMLYTRKFHFEDVVVPVLTKSSFVVAVEKRFDKSSDKRVLAGRPCITKVAITGTIIRLGQKIITQTELRELVDKGELMILGLVVSTGELTWEEAPAWEFLQDVHSTTLYHVSDPSKRIAKRFKSLPVNARLPYSVIESTTEFDEETRTELETFKAKLLQPDYEIYFELADKSGDVMKQGICRQSFLERLKAWANDIGGSFHTEAVC